QLERQAVYYVADPITGPPVARANVEYFGYRSTATRENGWRLDTLNFSESTDADGQILLGENKLPQDYSWVVIARKAKDGQGGADRLAHLGFRHVWDSAGHDPEYNAIKVFTITDRPVYRPQHTVQFKAWVRHAKYDQADTSDFAGKTFTVRIHNPKDEKVYEKNLTTDAYGGLNRDQVGTRSLASNSGSSSNLGQRRSIRAIGSRLMRAMKAWQAAIKSGTLWWQKPRVTSSRIQSHRRSMGLRSGL